MTGRPIWRRYFPDVPAYEIARTIRTEHLRYAPSPIRDFVPILIERAARRHLGQRSRLTSVQAPSAL